MIFAIDFDDTIHDPSNRLPGYKLGTPIPGAIEALRELVAAGHEYFIHSIWADTPQKRAEIAKWLAYFGAPKPKSIEAKPVADYYIDDRNIHFDSWGNVLDKLKGAEKSEEN